jgi:amidase
MAAIGSIPVGLSLVGWRGGDAALVGAACALADNLSIGLFKERR